MDKRLSSKELLELKKYRLCDEINQHFCVAELLNETYLRFFMKRLTNEIGAPSEKVAASIFIKRYAFIAVISLYAMTVWNKKLDLPLNQIYMETPETGKDWLPNFSMKDLNVQTFDSGNRDDWREGVLTDLFVNNIVPLIRMMEKTFGISSLILWENIAVYLFWLYETELVDREKDDYQFLFLTAKGNLFGCANGNPLQRYVTVKDKDSGIRMRKTCCFSYQLPAGKRCRTCPCTHLAKDGGCHDGEGICSAVRGFAGEVQ
ncbi:siderophore-iron reductase FhuF [Bacillus sp. JJ1764]|uniref:siderophore-iron reductase FhuF n=1 Tax=Bacillus sp. JJ1764 TaxID=3122964 RepID=UPI002FFFD15A